MRSRLSSHLVRRAINMLIDPSINATGDFIGKCSNTEPKTDYNLSALIESIEYTQKPQYQSQSGRSNWRRLLPMWRCSTSLMSYSQRGFLMEGSFIRNSLNWIYGLTASHTRVSTKSRSMPAPGPENDNTEATNASSIVWSKVFERIAFFEECCSGSGGA